MSVKTILLWLGPVCFLGLFLASLWANLEAPRIGASVKWDGSAWRVVQTECALQVGDQLVAIDGLPVGTLTFLADNVLLGSRAEMADWFAEKAALHQQMRRLELPVEVVRAGVSATVLVKPSKHSWPAWAAQSWHMLFPAVVFLWVGWVSLYRLELRGDSLSFYLMCCCTSFCYLTSIGLLLANPTIEPALSRFLTYVNLFTFVLGPAFMLHCTLLLGITKPNSVWVSAPPTLVERCLNHLQAKFYWIYGLALVTLASMHVPLQVGLVGTLYAVTLLVVGFESIRARGSVQRQQMKWVWFGYLLGLTPGLVLNALPLSLGFQRLVDDDVAGFFLTSIPVFYALAMNRYRLFDITSLLEGWLVYLFSLALLMLLEICLLGVTGRLLQLGWTELWLTALVALLYGVVRSRVALLVRLLFRRQHYQARDYLEDFQRRAQAQTSTGMVTALQDSVDLFLAPETLAPVAGANWIGAQLHFTEPISVELQFGGSVGLCSGALPGGRVYTSETLEILDQLAKSCHLFYRNAVLFEETQSQREKALEDRERLLSDLHDGVGATLANIRIVSQDQTVSELAADALFELQHFLYDSSDCTMSLDHLAAELRHYGQRVFDRSAMEFRFSCENCSQTISRVAGLSLFRLYREALSNCLRHSQATQVEACLEVVDECLRLSIQDNGETGGELFRGRGLEGMATRMQALGGKLSLCKDGGWRVAVELPL